MGLLEGRHNGRQILLSVAVLGSENPADLTHVRAVAMLDTGATTSAVSPRIVTELGLISSGKRLMKVATEERMVNGYLFRVGMFDAEQSKQSALGFPYVFAECNGFAIQDSIHFDVILGMDVLRQCDFTVNREGYWKLIYG